MKTLRGQDHVSLPNSQTSFYKKFKVANEAVDAFLRNSLHKYRIYKSLKHFSSRIELKFTMIHDTLYYFNMVAPSRPFMTWSLPWLVQCQWFKLEDPPRRPIPMVRRTTTRTTRRRPTWKWPDQRMRRRLSVGRESLKECVSYIHSQVFKKKTPWKWFSSITNRMTPRWLLRKTPPIEDYPWWCPPDDHPTPDLPSSFPETH